jgi:hypothetical protein
LVLLIQSAMAAQGVAISTAAAYRGSDAQFKSRIAFRLLSLVTAAPGPGGHPHQIIGEDRTGQIVAKRPHQNGATGIVVDVGWPELTAPETFRTTMPFCAVPKAGSSCPATVSRTTKVVVVVCCALDCVAAMRILLLFCSATS